jgi:hypothetical protein
MSPVSALPTIRQILCLVALAAVAAIAIVPALSSEAGASSGGIAAGVSTDSSDDSRTRPTSRYARIWRHRVTRSEKRWAARTSECESGRNPRAIGGGGMYRGAFQFMKATWRTSPKSPGGDPIRYSYRTQAVVAVMLKRRDGAGHWPVCG